MAKTKSGGEAEANEKTEQRHAHAVGAPPLGEVVVDGKAEGALSSLAEALERAPDSEEALAWATMSPANRDVALRRIIVLRQWCKDRHDLTAAIAAEKAGVKVARFYDLAARWKAGEKRLFDVGRFAKSQSERKGRFDADLLNELQGALPQVVKTYSHLPVAQQMQVLRDAVDSKGRAFPKPNTLREMIDRERRRQETRHQAGTEPGFDFIGSGLWRSGGGQHLIYAIIDRTSGLILGVAVGTYADSRAGYAAAAADALLWLSSPDVEGIAWSPQTSQIDIVPAGDADWWRQLDRRSAPVNCGLADSPKSPGRYFRAHIGPKLGRLKLSALGSAVSTEARDDVDTIDEKIALLQVRVEVAAHNSAVKGEMKAAGEPRPATTTLAAMSWVAGLAD